MAKYYIIPELPKEYSRIGDGFPRDLMNRIPVGVYYDPIRKEIVRREGQPARAKYTIGVPMGPNGLTPLEDKDEAESDTYDARARAKSTPNPKALHKDVLRFTMADVLEIINAVRR